MFLDDNVTSAPLSHRVVICFIKKDTLLSLLSEAP